MPDTSSSMMLAEAREALKAGRYAQAIQLGEDIVKKDARNIEALKVLGLAALEQGLFDDAMRRFRKCVMLRPKDHRNQYLIGRVLYDQGRSEEALDRFDKVLKADPAFKPAILSKAVTLERVGRYDEARGILDPIVARGEEGAAMMGMYARVLMHARQTGEAIDYLRKCIDERDLSPRDRQSMLFVLGKACDKAGEYDGAFEACRQANEIDKPVFDRQAYAARVDGLISLFTKERLATLAHAANRSDLPVLIAGMPRSGTTLVEQILDAHPAVCGAGELIFFSQMVSGLQMRLDSYEPYPDCIEDLTPKTAEHMGNSYLTYLRTFSRTAKRIVDKTLDNFEILGLVSLLLPGARAVICRRDPMDTCVSCYVNHILPQRYPFVADLGHLGFVYRQHERLVRHWRETLDIPMYEVVYEELVADQDRISRELIEFCGLPWDDRCARFHDSGRTVMTLSYEQVNRPMYNSSVARWRNYEKHLGQLREALEGSD